MKFTAEEIAHLLDGEIYGNPDVKVSKLSKIEEGGIGSLTFLSNSKYENYIYTTKASIVIVNKTFKPVKSVGHTTLIRVDDAYSAFTKLLQYHNQKQQEKTGVENPIFIHDTAKIGQNGYLGAFVYIGENTQIGNNVKIYPQVYIGDNVVINDNTTIFSGTKIYSDTKIGKNCIVHANAVIGSDGFGFAPKQNGGYEKIPQTGNVIIGNDVEIGSGVAIDRATLGSTIIHNGVKLDNLIMIAHNVEIGENTVIAAQTGIAGSTKIGRNCVIGGQVGIVGHLIIADDVKIQAQSGIIKSLKQGEIVQGTPAFAYSDFNKSYIHFKNLPKTIQNIENHLRRKS